MMQVAAMTTALHIVLEERQEHILLRLEGVLNQRTVNELDARWTQAGCHPDKPLLFDLQDLRKITAAGMQVLWVFTKPWVERRQVLYLRDNPAIAPLLAGSGLVWLFQPYTSPNIA